MSHTGTDSSYLSASQNAPAYTWASSPESLQVTYRTPHLPPLMSYRDWTIGSPPQSNATITQITPMLQSFQPSAVTYVSDITPGIAPPECASATSIMLDEHCFATPENLPGRGSPRAARRNSRRPNPVVVPNLTKKARGRPVPTKDTLLKPGSGRAYACLVEDCRKVFTRAEHLKRHTRSIHTNEKPFKCDEANCGRLFTRHDNLLQHLKNHRCASSVRDVSAEYGPLDRVHIAHTSPEPSSVDASHVSPSMGVLIPPSISNGIPMPYNGESAQAVQHYEVAMYSDDMSPSIGDASSSDGTPGPTEPSYLAYNYGGYPWPQSDIRTAPQATYEMVVQESRYSYPVKNEFAGTASAYAFHA